ncbi:MAG TPA: glycosyltransferase family 4 protein [Bryobacteraceae bacterium]|nr:glycosyltransferase family 4 protein [Bryobacteraceae bacterium]
MRLLHLDHGREMRGGQWQALRLHQGLHRLGHESLLLAPEGSRLLREAQQRDLPCDVLRPLRLGYLSRRFDVVHAHDARSHTLGALFARVPLVVSRRVAFPVRDSAASRWKYKQPALFLAVSRFVALQLRRAGIEDQRIGVVYDGVPVPPEPANGAAILASATLDPQKGLDLAEHAASIAGLVLEKSQNLEADLPRARALVYLTRSEGLGSGILLGMAHGITVIASNVDGIPELIQDGVNGILVPNNPEAIAGAFRRINAQLGQAARQTVIERFSEERMVRATLAAYERALDRAND